MASTTQSILLTIKKMLGIAQEYHAFDVDIIVHINASFLSLNQLGVGPPKPFRIQDESTTWSDFLGDDETLLEGVETYVYEKTRLRFDPPTSSFLVEELKKDCEELEWRLNVQVEGGEVTHGNEEQTRAAARMARRTRRIK